MNENEIKRFIAEFIQESRNTILPNAQLRGISQKGKTSATHAKSKHRTFSHKLMIFSCFIYFGTWAVAVTSWFLTREYPTNLVSMATWLFGASLAFYGAKSCVENKTSIEASAKVEMAQINCDDFSTNDFTEGHDEGFYDFK